MKLLIKPTVEHEEIEVWKGVKPPSFFDAWRTDEEKRTRRYRDATKVKVPGRMTITNIVIEDKDGILKLGEKYDEICLNGYKLQGVIPVSETDGERFECMVDHYTFDVDFNG